MRAALSASGTSIIFAVPTEALPFATATGPPAGPPNSRSVRVGVGWWMYVVVASFLALNSLNAYLVIRGPALAYGLAATFDEGEMRVRAVAPETPFARAGLRAGDRVLSVAGIPMRGAREWGAALANVQVGRPQTWHVVRGDSRLDPAVTFDPATYRFDAGVVAWAVGILGFFLLGLFIGLRRPNDPVSLVGAWLFLAASAAFGMLNGWAPLWRQAPLIVQAVLWIPQISRFAIEGIALSFFAIFPRRLVRARWIWPAIWIPVLVTLPWRVYGHHAVIHEQGRIPPTPDWLDRAVLVRLIVYAALGLLLVAINYRGTTDVNERRRRRVLLLGTAIGLGTAAYAALYYSAERYGVQPVASQRVIPLLLLLFPLTFAYAIVRHRVLDIQVIIRQGLQYALARRALLGVVPGLALALVIDLTLNSQQPLVGILRKHGWAYAGVGLLAVFASFRRRQWLDALDRHFFRERYDSLRVLREIVVEVQEASSIGLAAARVVTRIETALHPEFVSVMINEPAAREYRCLASVPTGHACPPIDGSSKLITLLHLLGRPIEVLSADSGWLQARLPEDEISFVRQARIDLLVPIATVSGRSEAFLALGGKRSEEPYTREDQDLLEAIASSLARLLERLNTASLPAADVFEECPQCGACYDAGARACVIDGALVTVVRLPRTLAGRYRLERRRGRGGMGSVYAALDKALGRRVAVKVIREHLVGTEIAQRFHREARAAAAFAHPNVVTVHDFGVEADTRAFLVMELLEGRTLRDELNASRRLHPSRALHICRGVSSAVEAAHRLQLIHRDLKPGNIFLAQAPGEPEIVKVLDFGMAKFLAAADAETWTGTTVESRSGVLMGTRGYMSPEQLLGETPAESWDLWALAVVAYEALTGALPFPAHSQSDWRRAVLAGEFTPLSEHLPDASPRLQMFFADSFTFDRTRRAQSAAELYQRLEEAST